MTPMRTLVLGAAAMIAATAGAEDKKTAIDPAKLAGSWTVTAGWKDGAKLEKAGGTLLVEKEKLTFKDEAATFVFKYTVDVKQTPAALDMEILEPEGFKGAKAKGIIGQDGKTVKIAYHPMGGDRPKEFGSKAGSGVFYFELKKADKE